MSTRTRLPSAWSIAPLAAALALALPAAPQSVRAREGAEVESGRSKRLVVLEGFVLGPDGAPAEGALVASSAGGRAVAGIDGRYRIELEVPAEARSIGLTARGPGAASAAARVLVALPGSGSSTVEPLVLGPATACDPRWIPSFGERPGMDSAVLSLTTFDDGSGPALFAGGDFRVAGSADANRIARWRGAWGAVGTGLPGRVYATTIGDDGRGPALFAGGDFAAPGNSPRRIARWNGSFWEPLGSGMDGIVRELASSDFDGADALYAGGSFLTAGGAAASRIARWGGPGWAPLGSGLDGDVHALAVFDDGTGTALYVGGRFRFAGGVAADRIARWNGTSWSAVGGGMDAAVRDLLVFDDGGGARLYACGLFTSAGGGPANRVARWDGTSWTALGTGMDDLVQTLAVFDDGGGAALHAGGEFGQAGGVAASRVARWDGASWAALGTGMEGRVNAVNALAVFDDGHGPALHAGGDFETAGGSVTNHVARWDGVRWSSLGSGANATVDALARLDLGGGPALYAGGEFTTLGEVAASRVARWNGVRWTPLGSGVDGRVWALAAFDDGSGPALYAGGELHTAGGVTAERIARWDGSSWTPLGTGMNNRVRDLAVFDDGGGEALYAVGDFVTAGGVSANAIARWDGSVWAPLGNGLRDRFSTFPTIATSLAVFDDGSGAALYAGGHFTKAGNVNVQFVARWSGSQWSAVGDSPSPFRSAVYSLAVFDDGSGPALHAGGVGDGSTPPGPARVARWNGSRWITLGSGMIGGTSFATTSILHGLAAFDDGSGPALYVGGSFDTADGAPANGVARWDGTRWTPLGGGMSGTVFALAAFDDGGGPALHAGGDFLRALDSGDSYLAKWGRDCPVRLDFEHEDDFLTPLVNGQDLSTPPELGNLVALTSSGPNAGAAIFDSTPGGPNDPSQDRDLLVGSGKLLILQTDASTAQSVPGRFDRPNDDEDGGTLTFTFTARVEPVSLDLVDIDAGAGEATHVRLTDRAGRLHHVTVPPDWTGDRLTGGDGRRTLDLVSLAPQPGFRSTATAVQDAGFDPAAVVELEVELGGSGALDNLVWRAAPALQRPPRHLSPASGVPPGSIPTIGPR